MIRRPPPIPEPLATSLRLHAERGQRIGMRSALSDASVECDRIAAAIIGGNRPSKQRDKLAQVANDCAAAIDRLRQMVEVPYD